MVESAVGRPESHEYGPFYAGYVERAAGDDPLGLLERQLRIDLARLRELPAERGDFRYAPGKWSIRELVAHLADAEREFSHRAHRFSRGDETPLPGFDENRFVAALELGERSVASLVDELADLRRATLALFSHLPAGAWTRGGEASGVFVSVRALAFILAGHFDHHMAVMRERYEVG